MKLSIVELRDMVAQAVRRTVREAKGPKLPAARSEESTAAERARHVRGLPGYAHSAPLDMSKPLGKRNRVRRQGASNIGNWTSEARIAEGVWDVSIGSGGYGITIVADTAKSAKRKAQEFLSSTGVDPKRYELVVRPGNPNSLRKPMADPRFDDVDDPAELGIKSESKLQAESMIRKLVRMIVSEEVRVSRR